MNPGSPVLGRQETLISSKGNMEPTKVGGRASSQKSHFGEMNGPVLILCHRTQLSYV